MKILFIKRNILSASIVNYLSVVEPDLEIYWSHICSDLMGDLINPKKKTTVWDQDYTLLDEFEMVEVSNGLYLAKDLYKKHKKFLEDQNYLLNFCSAITPHNNKVIRERIFNV